MTHWPATLAFVVLAYFIGATPFGWLIARLKGVRISQHGSGNIGATNVGRVLGRKYAVVCFVLDFFKGCLAVLLADRLAPGIAPEAFAWTQNFPESLRVACAVAVFVGHIFPVWLRFKGGKGVATGAGAILVLVPGPGSLILVIFAATVGASGFVSLGSLVAVGMLMVMRLIAVREPFGHDNWLCTSFVVGGTAMVWLKHRANIGRLLEGTESRLNNRGVWEMLARVIHILSLSLWLGSAVFFTFVAAPKIFASFQEVVATAPSDRTAWQPLSPDTSPEAQKRLGSALGGAAVGPIFPVFFGIQGVCGLLALIAALGWRKWPGRVNRVRVWVIGLAWLTAIGGWPLSQEVTRIRLERFSTDPAVAQAAKEAFGPIHLASLGLSMLTTLLVLVAVALIAWLPGHGQSGYNRAAAPSGEPK